MTYDSNTQKNINEWLHGSYDEETKNIIRHLVKENSQEIIDAFYTNLSFGTGGLRGIMGIGSNRINFYTISAATQGLANYINKQTQNSIPFVCIGFDSRKNSRQFAEETAKVLAGNGIGVYLFKELRPTPLVSFGCRFKKCIAAIMITASHNPPNYNGYKVYWTDGSQVLPPHDQNIIREINLIKDPIQVRKVSSTDNPLINIVDTEIDIAYLKTINKLNLHPEINYNTGNTLKVVYTSLHGTGITIIPQALREWGFTNLSFVDEQIIPDENFSTVASPNPEERETLSLGIEKLKEKNADILIATDPDADRVGVAVTHQGAIHLLTGNQLASVCLEHICSSLKEQNRLPTNAGFIKTIATTELFKTIAAAYNTTCADVLTGFKYIAEKIEEWETTPGSPQFIFGGEESYGYLLGTQTRDKDAVISSALICDVALHAKNSGKTLIDLLNNLYMKYGIYFETLCSMKYEESKRGKEKMMAFIDRLQNFPPETINGIQVSSFEDYHQSIRKNFVTHETSPLTLPSSNALLFWLVDNSKLLIRPSGTEPKIKIYCEVCEKSTPNIPQTLISAEKKAKGLIDAIKSMG